MTTTTGVTTEPVERTTTPARRPTRRRHAAAGGRILAAGLSVGTALGIVGILARNEAVDAAAAPPTAPVTPQIVVRVVTVDDANPGDTLEAAAAPLADPTGTAPVSGTTWTPAATGAMTAATPAAPVVTVPAPTVRPAPVPTTTVARTRAS